MKNFAVILGLLLSCITNAWADVCYDIDDKAADKAVEIIRNQKEIYKYCSICPETVPESIVIKDVQNNEGVTINGEAIDVAHTYYKENNQFINIGIASGCIKDGEYGIDAKLSNLAPIYETKKEEKQAPKYYTCEDLTFPQLIEDKPLLSMFLDAEIARKTNECFTQKIENSLTPKQFEYYGQVYANLEAVLQAMLFYKGKPYEQYIAMHEMLYMFQKYFYAQLNNDKSYDFPIHHPYKTSPESWGKERPLEQEMLKITNLEARRKELQYLNSAISAMGNFFYSSGIQDTDILQRKKMDFITVVYQFVMKIKQDKYFMDPNNSIHFFNDCVTWEIMSGEKTTGWGTKKLSCPIQFP